MTRHHITIKETKKHSQFILAVDAAYYREAICQSNGGFEGMFAKPINIVPHEAFCEDAQSYLVIREREYLDESISYMVDNSNDVEITGDFIKNTKGDNKKGDPRYKQLLPYIIARQLQKDGTYLYFPYRRTKKVGESRLAGNGSLGYGGHIDLEDIVSTKSVINLRETILKSTWREAVEEFKLVPVEGNNAKLMASNYHNALSFGDLFIVDNSNDVGELHLGIIMYFDVPQGWTLESSEDELAKLPPMTANQMLIDPDFNAENWTRIYLDHYYNLPQFEEGDGGDNPNTEFDVDESGLERELIDTESEDDIPDSEGSKVLSIDHGGEKVGEIDQSYFTNLAVPNYATQIEEAKDRNVFHVELREGEEPIQAIESILNSVPQGISPTNTLISNNDGLPHGVISTIPDDIMKALKETGQLPTYQNNIDWNNTITGSPTNIIDLNLNELEKGMAVTNAVNVKPTES